MDASRLGDIDPQQKTYGEFPGSLYVNRVHKRQPFHKKSTIFPGDLISYTLPDLEENVLIPQKTWCLTFDYEQTGTKDKAQFPVQNLANSLISVLRIKMSGKTVLELDNYSELQNYIDLHMPEQERKKRLAEGFDQTDDDLKARVGSEGATPSAKQTLIKNVHGSRFKLMLDFFELFRQVGPIYPYALQDKEIVIELRFARAEEIVRGSTATKRTATDRDYSYKLVNIKMEYDEFNHPYFASQMASKYRGLRLKYKKVSCIPTTESKKSDTRVSLRFDAPGDSIAGVLILAVDKDTKRAEFNHDVTSFYNANIKNLFTTYKGSSHRLYENGMQPQDLYDALLKLFPNTEVSEEDFLTDKYAIWLDMRLSARNDLHGSGKNFRVGDELHLQINRNAEASGNLIYYTYIFQDATLINQNGRFIEEDAQA